MLNISDNCGIYVMQDYKLRTATRRPERSGWLRLAVAFGILAVTFAVVRLVDLPPARDAVAERVASNLPISQPLHLPKPGELMSQTWQEPVFPLQPQNRTTSTSATGEATATTVISGTRLPEPQVAEIVETPQQSFVGEPIAEPLEGPSGSDQTIEPEPGDPASSSELVWVVHSVVKGESLAKIFAQQGLEAKLLHSIVNASEEARSLADIRPGQQLRFQFDENRELTKLELHRNRVDSLRVSLADDEIRTEQVIKDIEKRVASAAGVIESSLFSDGQKAGLSDRQIMELANIFGWDIDFALEIRAGDHFRVLYEEQYLEGEKLRDGPILAAEFTNSGTTYLAVRYEDDSGEVGYFDPDGQSKRRAFIRTPIKFARVSSRFNPRRWHPILKTWRSHKGVDYAAPSGTPVKATGDGKVVFRGTKNGYGKTVMLEHGGKYTTLYAHLSAYSKRAETGKRVKQGQVIGYVGKTGLASGPHLHYEFRVNGVHWDPLKVKLPKSLTLPTSEIAKFRKSTAPLLAQLESIPAETMVASLPSVSSNTP